MSTFPAEFAGILACPTCGAILDVGAASCCGSCGRGFDVEHDGRIVKLLRVDALVGESRREKEIRDQQVAERPRRDRREVLSDPHEVMEMAPTMEWLALRGSESILELGCGTGRYTEVLAAQGCKVLAMDFSSQALLTLEGALRALGIAENVGLVNASIGDFSVAPGSFDVVLSTLTSNLPDRRHRQAMYALAATALKPGGRFVFSAHHFGLRARRERTPKRGLYQAGGIFREYLTASEIREEIGGSFEALRLRPIRIYLSFLSRHPALRVRMSRWAGNIPLLRELGDLLLMEARRPVVSPHATVRWNGDPGPVLGIEAAGAQPASLEVMQLGDQPETTGGDETGTQVAG
jgi:SAM-dependent methyltransferase